MTIVESDIEADKATVNAGDSQDQGVKLRMNMTQPNIYCGETKPMARLTGL